MYRLSRLRIIFPVGLLVAFFLDGSLSKIFAPQFFVYPYAVTSLLTVLWLVFACFFEGQLKMPLVGFAVAAGVCTDLYYTGILGLFMFLYPLMVVATRAVNRYYSPSFLVQMLIFFVDVTVLEFLNYGAYELVGVIHHPVSDFLITNLGPTLALNLIYFVLLYWPVRQVYRRALAAQH